MKHVVLMFGIVSMVVLSLTFASAQEDEGGGEFGGGVDGTNNLIEPTPEPTPTEIPEDHRDTNNIIIAPDPNKSGKIEIAKPDDSEAIVTQDGLIVERIALMDDSGCLRGTGQIGNVEFCGSDPRLMLNGRPTQVCPQDGTNYLCHVEEVE